MPKVYIGFIILALAVSLHAAVGMTPIETGKRFDLTSLSLEELSTLEVTSVSKAPEKYLKAPAAIYVITQDDIHRSGVTSIPEALRMAPGVNVERINSNQWSIGVRGFGDRLARSVLVLIDGRAVYSPLFAGTYWELQDYPLDDIDRIEVIRGPGGALWGANAFNGVINIITKSAKNTQGALVSGGGGTEERGFGTTRYGGKIGAAFNYRAYGTYFNRDSSFHANDNNFDAWQVGRGGFRTDWDMTSRDSLTMQGDLYKGETGDMLTNATYAPPFSQTLTQNADVFGANVLGRWKRDINTTLGLSLQWYYDRTNRTDLNFTELRDTIDVDFQYRVGAFWRQELTWGTQYRMSASRITSIPTIVFDPSNRTDHLVTAFIQDQIPLVENVLALTFGTKVEHNDFSGWEEEPSGRLAWTPTPQQTLWTAVSRAVATPSQVDQDFTATLPGLPGAPVFVRLVNNKNFQTEKLTAYEVGYRIQPAESLLFDLSAFYNRYDSLLSGEAATPFFESTPSPTHFVFPIVLGNKFEGETHGLEWASTWNLFSWWRWRADYSLLLIHMHLTPDSTDPSARAAITAGSSPRHQASLQWSMDLPWHWEWDPTIRYQDHLSYSPITNAKPGISTYWNLDMRVAWHATSHLELSLVGQNLLENHHAEAIPTEEIQRGFYGKATWQW